MKLRHAARNWTIAVAAALALPLSACARPAEERAERDRSVGQARGESLAVAVKDGLAAVRALEAARLVLWGSAPSYEFTLTSAERTSVTVELQNCLSDAELVALEPSEIMLTEEPSGRPTRRLFTVELPAGASRLRVAAPDADDAGPFRFALLSDVQEAIDRVSDIFERLNLEPDVRFLLGAGDLTERGSVEELERYQRELEALDVPYFTTLGNHELGQSPSRYHDYFGRGNFQFGFRGVSFTLLDSASATLDPIVYGWLDGWLKAAENRVHVVSMHIPPLDPIGVRNGAFASRPEAAKLLAKLAEGNVDLTVYGHIHSYYSFENAGIQAYISGGGGAIPERFDDVGRHFLVFDIHAEQGVVDQRRVEVDD
jgi:Icc-related predicted phosphoesterase